MINDNNYSYNYQYPTKPAMINGSFSNQANNFAGGVPLTKSQSAKNIRFAKNVRSTSVHKANDFLNNNNNNNNGHNPYYNVHYHNQQGYHNHSQYIAPQTTTTASNNVCNYCFNGYSNNNNANANGNYYNFNSVQQQQLPAQYGLLTRQSRKMAKSQQHLNVIAVPIGNAASLFQLQQQTQPIAKQQQNKQQKQDGAKAAKKKAEKQQQQQQQQQQQLQQNQQQQPQAPKQKPKAEVKPTKTAAEPEPKTNVNLNQATQGNEQPKKKNETEGPAKKKNKNWKKNNLNKNFNSKTSLNNLLNQLTLNHQFQNHYYQPTNANTTTAANGYCNCVACVYLGYKNGHVNGNSHGFTADANTNYNLNQSGQNLYYPENSAATSAEANQVASFQQPQQQQQQQPALTNSLKKENSFTYGFPHSNNHINKPKFNNHNFQKNTTDPYNMQSLCQYCYVYNGNVYCDYVPSYYSNSFQSTNVNNPITESSNLTYQSSLPAITPAADTAKPIESGEAQKDNKNQVSWSTNVTTKPPLPSPKQQASTPVPPVSEPQIYQPVATPIPPPPPPPPPPAPVAALPLVPTPTPTIITLPRSQTNNPNAENANNADESKTKKKKNKRFNSKNKANSIPANGYNQFQPIQFVYL